MAPQYIDPMVYNLARLLSYQRLHNFKTWIQVGMCLHNISPDLLDLWDEISQVSDKWTPICCQKFWNSMNNNHVNPLTIKSLHYWAKHDNPDGYIEMLQNMMQPCRFLTLQ
jgi:hypothetical protein